MNSHLEAARQYFDVRKFTAKEFALLLIENQKAKLAERVGNYEGFVVDGDGVPNFKCERATLTDERELLALKKAADMARQGYTNFWWISAPGGDYNYPGSRFTHLRVANIDAGGNVYFDGNRAVCGELIAEKCMMLADRLVVEGGVMSGKVGDAEELRGEVIAFGDVDMFEIMAESLVEMGSVWQAIENGDDRRNLEKMMEVAEMVERRYGERMRQVTTKREAVVVGYEVEMMVRRQFGINLLDGGPHGFSNAAIMGRMQVGASVFNSVFAMSTIVSTESLDPRLQYCEIHKVYFMKKKGQCPKCKG